MILGFNNLASPELGEQHPLQHELGEVRIAAEYSAALTKDLLAFAGHQMLERQPIPAGQIAHDVRRLLGPALGTGIELVIEDSSDEAIVLGDLAQLKRALLYLALNARDAMPDGGRLAIRTAITEPPGQTGPTPPTVSISISDTGTGISDEVRQRMFEPFFTTKDVGEGTGLGLAAVLGIVEQTGGTITVESELGHGSTFVVTLPQREHP